MTFTYIKSTEMLYRYTNHSFSMRLGVVTSREKLTCLFRKKVGKFWRITLQQFRTYINKISTGFTIDKTTI